LLEWEEKEVHLSVAEEECIEEADEGELLLLRRTLSDQVSPNHGVQKEEEMVYAVEDDMLEFNPNPKLIDPTPKSEPNDSIVFNDSNLKPYFVDGKLEKLRANSFLEGDNDGHVGGLLGLMKHDSSQQESKAKNWLFKAPRAVGKAAAAPGLLFVFDQG